MIGSQLWRSTRTLSLAAAIAAAFMVFPVATSSTPAPVALASDDNDNRDSSSASEDDGEDRNLEGQVIELFADREPPEMVVAQLDGDITARILKTDEIAIWGVQVGDYVHLQGEYDGGFFNANSLDVTERYGAADDDGDDDGSSDDDSGDDD